MAVIEPRPSKAESWLECTASLVATAGMQSPPKRAAREGTVAHWVHEQAFRERRPASDYIGAVCPDEPKIPVTEDMATAVQISLDYIARVWAAGRVLYTEAEVTSQIDLGVCLPQPMKGTADMLMLQMLEGELTLHVFDYKNGRGIRVYVHENPQLTLYAIGAIQRLARMGVHPTRVILHIMQPNLGQPSHMSMTMEQVRQKASFYQSRLEEATGPSPVFRPSETACRWCPLSGKCEAQAEKRLKEIAPLFQLVDKPLEPTDTQPVGTLDNSRLSLLGFSLPAIRAWADDVEQRIREIVANAPDTLRAWKLVPGRRITKWLDEEAAVMALLHWGLDEKDYLKEPPLKSPSEMKKHIGATQFNVQFKHLLEETRATPELVPASDPRPSIHQKETPHG